MIKCANCFHEIKYFKPDRDYDFSCKNCNYQYKYYAAKNNFKPESIEPDLTKQKNNSPKCNSKQVLDDGYNNLDGCENWGIDG